MIKFTESMLSKMKKKELIDLILQIQEECDSNKAKTLYEATDKGDRKIVINVSLGRQGSLRYYYTLKPGDVMEIATEEITPSGYPSSGTYGVVCTKSLAELLGEKEYERLKKIGWNTIGLKQVVFPALEEKEENEA